jgi:imidazolonepropionase-like amidohydrolase
MISSVLLVGRHYSQLVRLPTVTVPFLLPALLADPMPPDRVLVLVNARVFDGSGGPVLETDQIMIERGRVSGGAPAGDATVIDLEGRFLMPGLINAHTHLAEQVEVEWREGMEPVLDQVKDHLTASLARRALRMGITTVRDVGARGDTVLALRQAMRFGAFLGPRILTSGRIVSPTAPGGRHFAGMYREADGPDEIRKAVREQIRRGADFVKIMATGARSVEIENPEPPQLTREELAAFVDEAHRQGYRAAAHAEGLEGSVLAIEEGADTIEHGFYLSRRPDMLERMATDGQTLVPTLSFLRDIVDGTHADWSAALIERGRYNIAEADKTLLAATSAGVNVAMGSDSRPEERAAGELALMVGAGMSTVDALVTATAGSARALGLDHLIGHIGDGMAADLMVVDGDPLDDISILTDPARVEMVVRAGHVAHISAGLQPR